MGLESNLVVLPLRYEHTLKYYKYRNKGVHVLFTLKSSIAKLMIQLKHLVFGFFRFIDPLTKKSTLYRLSICSEVFVVDSHNLQITEFHLLFSAGGI